MQSNRDAEIVAWIGALGAAGAEHVMRHFGIGRTHAYRHLSALARDGLLEHHRVLHGRPGLFAATRPGLRWCGLGRLRVFTASPGGFEHAWQVADAAVALCGGLPDWQALSEREIRCHERDQGKLLACARVGSRGGGVDALHRPDLALFSPSGRVVAVEVELTRKDRARMLKLCNGWARARHVDRVYYLALPAAAAAVSGRCARPAQRIA